MITKEHLKSAGYKNTDRRCDFKNADDSWHRWIEDPKGNRLFQLSFYEYNMSAHRAHLPKSVPDLSFSPDTQLTCYDQHGIDTTMNHSLITNNASTLENVELHYVRLWQQFVAASLIYKVERIYDDGITLNDEAYVLNISHNECVIFDEFSRPYKRSFKALHGWPNNYRGRQIPPTLEDLTAMLCADDAVIRLGAKWFLEHQELTWD